MSDLAPIRKTLDVPLPPREAFALFTERLGEWWPVETHSLSAGEGRRPRAVTVEPRVGGQVLETLPDGDRAPWARVTGWEPGRRFRLDWHVGRDEDEATQVEVIFTSQGDGTRVELIHDGFTRLGDVAAAAHGSYLKGWDLVLGRYTAVAPAGAKA